MALNNYIFVTGGVMSSLGKGLASASLGALLQARGFKVCLRKLDLYLNVDPGTLSPYQHGEVFVTDDGTEADLDLGHYERFTGYRTTKADYLSAGEIYENIILTERKGGYNGSTVQVIPHVTDAIKRFIFASTESFDFTLIEIGGTVGDIEGAPFLEAIRQVRNELGAAHTMFIHLTYLPYVKTAGELKTKPTQHSVKDLLHAGIQPDLLLCRCEIPLDVAIRSKIALFCNMTPDNVIAALDVRNIYRCPTNYSREYFDERVCHHFNLDYRDFPLSKDWNQKWGELVENIDNPRSRITIVVVGKYTELPDAYKSLREALTHAGAQNQVGLDVRWCNSEQTEDVIAEIRGADGIIVPGGFGARGIENKIKAIQYARENDIPFLGICLGMQLAIIESFRNIAGVKDANSTEFDPDTNAPVISLISEWTKNDGSKERRTKDTNLGGTLRLGQYPCDLVKGSFAHKAYQQDTIQERHRHRYEFNAPKYKEQAEQLGLVVTGSSPDGTLTEIIEHKNHPWFVAVQFHPEFKSTPIDGHPLFVSFIKSATTRKANAS
ncbi:MAG: CTP synthase [Holosporales bacterium]|jgi:CTP synthase|nr:CTP synthase [Holosporales bacterium]